MLALLPEIVLIVAAFVVLISTIYTNNSKIFINLALLAILTSMGLLLNQGPGTLQIAFDGRFVVDSVAWWFKLIFLTSGLFVLLMVGGHFTKSQNGDFEFLTHGGEFVTIALFILTGSMFLVSSTDLVSLYVALELTTIPSALLIAWQKRNEHSLEAGIKYILIGAVSSAFLLWAFGLCYGISGSTELSVIGSALANQGGYIWYLGALLLVSVGFKLTIVPFHLWAADVYHGAPTTMTAWLSSASKAIGLALAFIVCFKFFGGYINSMAMPFAILAGVTMTLGNVVALVQTNVKRIMAFSAISQAGYFFMGFLSPDTQGITAILYYTLIYVVCNFTVFAIIISVTNKKQTDSVEAFKGLSISNPVISLVMLLALLSLAGVPPLSGFVGKFFLFNIAAKAHMYWLVGIAAVNSTISLYYYLNIVKKMYMESDADSLISSSLSQKMLLAMGSVGIVLFGIIPSIYNSMELSMTGWTEPFTQMIQKLF